MRCYRARCILKESIIRRTRDSEEEYDTFFDEKNQLINEFNEMARHVQQKLCLYIKCRKRSGDHRGNDDRH